MNERFKGEVFVSSDLDRRRFEDVAFRCGYCVATKPLGNEAYKMTFYTDEEAEAKH